MDPERSPAEQIEIELDLAPGMEAEEDTLDRRRINTPSRQGATIPQGWKPTIQKPVPVMRCHYVWPDDAPRGGERCNRWSLRGSQLCYIHSGRGNLRNVEEYRLAILEAARLQLTEAVPDAMATLLDLAANATGENVKLKAATEVLDRAGIKTAEELNVNLEVSAANPAAVLAERMAKLKKAADLAAEMQRRSDAAVEERLALESPAVSVIVDTDDGDVIEGEVVEDSSSTADTDD